MQSCWAALLVSTIMSAWLAGCESGFSREPPNLGGSVLSVQAGEPVVVQTSQAGATIPAVSTREIAEHVHARYRDAKFIHFEELASRNGQSIRYTYDGSPDSLRTIAFHDGSLYGAFSMHNNRVQEFVPEHPQRLLLEYDAEMPDQIPWLVYPRELDCVYGMAFGIWIGPQSLTRFSNLRLSTDDPATCSNGSASRASPEASSFATSIMWMPQSSPLGDG